MDFLNKAFAQITELFRSCFPSELPHVLDVLPRGAERW